MTKLIADELYRCFIMIYGGLAVMFLFEVRNKIMSMLGQRRRLAVFIYLGSWLCAGFLFSEYLYRGAKGQLTVYCAAAFILGLILWKKFVYGIIDTGKNYENKQKREKKS